MIAGLTFDYSSMIAILMSGMIACLRTTEVSLNNHPVQRLTVFTTIFATLLKLWNMLKHLSYLLLSTFNG